MPQPTAMETKPARVRRGAQRTGAAMQIAWWTQPSPVGRLTVAVTAAGVCRIAFDDENDVEEVAAALSGGARIARRADATVRRELDAYFRRRLERFTVPVNLSLVSSARRKYLRAVRRVPYGRTASYGAVAGRAGRPQAARAAGQAVAANPVPILVPCHRIISADGTLGGYSGGLQRKRILLRLEGHTGWGGA